MNQNDAHTAQLSVDQLTVRLSGNTVLSGISFTVHKGECLAVIGDTGSGKTTLVNALAGSAFHAGQVRFHPIHGKEPKRLVIGRQHRFKNLSNIQSFYYQQRFNAFDAEDSRTVEDELKQWGADDPSITRVLNMLDIQHLRQTRLIQLSNGEHKRFQLAEALLQKADWLLLDSPYIGLDVSARAMLNRILDELSKEGVRILLVTGHTDMPTCITQVAILEQGKLGRIMTRQEFDAMESAAVNQSTTPMDPAALRQIPEAYAYPDFTLAVKMVDTSIVYGERRILDRINWEVRKGECWSLSGPNGSGKSTLLSLINGDNPQAFANEIYLFDRKKGSGESIWDIKQKIGYISPELHHYFDGGSTCFDIVASGLFDTMGLFRKLNPFQEQLTTTWMDLLHVSRFAGTYFQRLSDGEQRRVLLARAMVKNPPMLILDEPCQGLDDAEQQSFVGLVDTIYTTLGKTLIYVSHYEAELPSCIRKRIVLHEGRVARIVSL